MDTSNGRAILGEPSTYTPNFGNFNSKTGKTSGASTFGEGGNLAHTIHIIKNTM